MNTTIAEIMNRSGVRFGTSGARGLAVDFTPPVCRAYTRGFLQYLGRHEAFSPGMTVAVGGDLRPSTGRIMASVLAAIAEAGGTPLDCGRVPSPALAAFGFRRRIPSIMVTGSHIPDDRNGIKFNKPTGEILKADETGMMAEVLELPAGCFDTPAATENGAPGRADADPGVAAEYLRRYLDAFPGRPLTGARVGVYQHSAVGRDLLVEILKGLGASVTALGRSATFLPVDTEAVRPEDVALARGWAATGDYDAIVSTDGDSDRPLISDERGEWLRGDLAGVLCARYLEADSVATPVSSNTAAERCGWFPEVRRTRIGSPYVAAALEAAEQAGRRRVVGYEANGGFLVQTDFPTPGGILPALPTRDAVVVLVTILQLARREGRTVSQLLGTLPPRFTASDRLRDFATERGRRVLAELDAGEDAATRARWDRVFGGVLGAPAAGLDRTDGLRMTFANGEILHVRPSGNAPEFRCYTEAGTAARATALCERALQICAGLASA